MVKHKAEVEVTATDKATPVLQRLGNFIKSRLVLTFGELVQGVKKLIGVFVDLSKAASDQELADKKLEQSLKNQAIYTDTLAKSMKDYAGELQKTTIYSDEQIESLQGMLLNYGIAVDRINDVTQATMDLSAGIGIDLESAALMISKSMGSDVGGALSRYGIKADGAAGSTEKLNSIINSISKKFGGQAKVAADSFSGSLEKNKHAVDELKETFGKLQNEGLAPYLSTLNSVLIKTNEVLKAFSGGGTEVEVLSSKLASLRAGLKVLEKQFDPLGTYSKVIKERKDAILKTETELVAARKRQQEKETTDAAKLTVLEAQRQTKIKIDAQKEANEKLSDERIKDELHTQEEIEKSKIESIDRQAEKQKEYLDYTTGLNKEFTDILLNNQDDIGKAIGNMIKQRLGAEIDAWAATEIAKALAGAPMSFGATLAAIAPITAAAAAGKAVLGGIQFEKGGIVPGTSTSGDNVAARVNSGEMILNKTQQENLFKMLNQGGSGSTVSVNLMLDKKVLAREMVNINAEYAKGLL